MTQKDRFKTSAHSQLSSEAVFHRHVMRHLLQQLLQAGDDAEGVPRRQRLVARAHHQDSLPAGNARGLGLGQHVGGKHDLARRVNAEAERDLLVARGLHLWTMRTELEVRPLALSLCFLIDEGGKAGLTGAPVAQESALDNCDGAAWRA